MVTFVVSTDSADTCLHCPDITWTQLLGDYVEIIADFHGPAMQGESPAIFARQNHKFVYIDSKIKRPRVCYEHLEYHLILKG